MMVIIKMLTMNKTMKRYIYTILITVIFLVLNTGAIKAEEKKQKTWTVDYQKDYHSKADLTGRFVIKDDDLFKPYLITGGNLQWDTMPKEKGKEPTIKDIYRYDVGVNFGAGVSWNVSKGVSLYAEPYLKYTFFENDINLSTGKKDGEKMDQNLKFGIHYGF
jgi:outer membrane protein W